MINNIKKSLFKGIFLKNRTVQKIKEILKSEKGSFDPVIAVIFAAILILAVLASQGTVNTIFTDFVNDFQTWFDTKKTSLFS